MRSWVILCSLALLAVGCEDKPSSPPPPSTAQAASGATGSAAVAAADPDAELDNEDIPVPEDFEDEARKSISDDNLESKLEEIEKELAQDKG